MFEQLEIIRLSQQGEQKRRISCLVGRVSVFRSTSESELELYIRALRGETTEDRFSLLLDSSVFNPAEHWFVGFGETFSSDITMTVVEYLASAGFNPEEIEPVALAHGLGGLSRAHLGELSSGQARTLRLLAATANAEHITILNDPFDDVPDAWREALAERIVRFAWKQKAIVVITRLSYRPECWVENEFVTRIPLQRPRQHTIGMGGGEFSSQRVVADVRDQLNRSGAGNSVLEAAAASRERAEDKLRQKLIERSGSHLTSVGPQPPDGFKFNRAITMLGGVAALLVVAIGVVMNSSGGGSVTTPTISPAIGPINGLPQSNPNNLGGDIHKAVQGSTPTHGDGTNNTTAVSPQTALDEYPEEIRRAVIQAANDPDVLLKNVTATMKYHVSPRLTGDKPANSPSPPTIAPAAIEPEQSEPSASDLGREMTEEEIQARREEIRRKFLEAIQRQAGFGG